LLEFYFCGLAIFGVLRELIFEIRTDWFFWRGINFCDFQKVPGTQHCIIFVFIEWRPIEKHFQAISQYFVVSE